MEANLVPKDREGAAIAEEVSEPLDQIVRRLGELTRLSPEVIASWPERVARAAYEDLRMGRSHVVEVPGLSETTVLNPAVDFWT